MSADETQIRRENRMNTDKGGSGKNADQVEARRKALALRLAVIERVIFYGFPMRWG